MPTASAPASPAQTAGRFITSWLKGAAVRSASVSGGAKRSRRASEPVIQASDSP